MGALWAALLGLVFAANLLSLDFLHGTSPFWQQENADLAQYLAGFNAFIRESWHWPLLRIESLNAPQGTLATFVDVVPLYALILKAMHHGEGVAFWNPYGIWIGICFTLQGVGAWWICREAQIRSWIVLTVLTLLLVNFPALLHRLNHISLMSQWLLLFGYAVYLRSSRLQRLATTAWICLVPLAFYINIYLFSMLSAIFFADLLRHVQRGQWRDVSRAFTVAYGILALSLLITMLPLGSGSGLPEWGFGYYSMNLLAPFDGGRLLHFPHSIARKGQEEGFNYLGIFVLISLAYALILRMRRDPHFWSRHAILAIEMVLLTLYAISNIIYLGDIHVYYLVMPEWAAAFTSQLRVSGRFFWPVGYAMVIFAIITIYRYGGRNATTLICAVLVLQLWDVEPIFHSTWLIAHGQATSLIDETRWNDLLGADTKTLQYYPPFTCGTSVPADTILPVMLYASKHHLNMSTGYIARVSKSCAHFENEIRTLKTPGTAFVFEKSSFPTPDSINTLFKDQPTPVCTDVRDIYYVCKRGNVPPGATGL